MKTAWLFAGQGSQTVGMGRDFYERFPEVRHIFESETAGFDIRDVCFNGPIEKLSRTRYTQPCMAAFAAALIQILKGCGLSPDFTAGLSLGEYSALHASGVFDAEELLQLLAFRGVAMEESATGVDAKMTAVLGLSEELTRRAVAEAATDGVVVCANFNCPGQIVIGGERSAVEQAEKNCQKLGARRCMPLQTSGPFHTPFMADAADKLRNKLSNTHLEPQQARVVFNAIGDTAPDTDIPKLLEEQVKSPVLFEKSIRKLSAEGVTHVIEIGPGHTLVGFVRKTEPSIKCVSIEELSDLEKLEGFC
jgi:[acyl-carrier-protein] S-malonyltransferase